MAVNLLGLSDLRARAGEYQEQATRVKDSELHDQFLDLAKRYAALAEKQEGVPNSQRKFMPTNSMKNEKLEREAWLE